MRSRRDPDLRRSELVAIDVEHIVEQAQARVARSVNTAMVHAYWHLGREIVESEQQDAARADYGEALIRSVVSGLQARFGRGFSYFNVKRIKQFYLTYPEGSSVVIDEKGATVSRLSAAGGKGATPSRLSESPGSIKFPATLSWSHYRSLMRIATEPARSFYEIEAVQGTWSVRELDRQIGTLLYKRLSRSRDAAGVRALSRRPGARPARRRDQGSACA